jgi:transposase
MREKAEKLERRRRAAIRLLYEGKKVSAIARRLKVSRQVVYQWKKKMYTGGLHVKFGRPRKLSVEYLKKILQPTLDLEMRNLQIWTTQKVADAIWKKYQVRYHPDHVRRILHELEWRWLAGNRKYKVSFSWIPRKP